MYDKKHGRRLAMEFSRTFTDVIQKGIIIKPSED